jgi:hypothetical protein
LLAPVAARRWLALRVNLNEGLDSAGEVLGRRLMTLGRSGQGRIGKIHLCGAVWAAVSAKATACTEDIVVHRVLTRVLTRVLAVELKHWLGTGECVAMNWEAVAAGRFVQADVATGERNCKGLHSELDAGPWGVRATGRGR